MTPLTSVSIPSPSCPPPSRLDAYFDRELPEADRAQIESHLANCPACRESLDHIAATSSLVKSIELPAMSPMGRTRVLHDLTESAASAPRAAGRDRWLLPVRLLTAVAAAIFILATSLIVYQLHHPATAPGGTPIQPIITHPSSPGSHQVLPTGATNPATP